MPEKRHFLGDLAFFLAPKKSALPCLILVCWAFVACAQAKPYCEVDPASLTPWTVAAVVDGDTLRLAGGDKVRLIGINTPELGRESQAGQPLAREAAETLAALIGADSQVLLQDGREMRDRHGRRLAHGYDLAGRNLVAKLLRIGMGFHVAIAPNVTHLDCLQLAEAEAARAGLGVWAGTAYQPLAVGDLAARQGGFHRLRDRVTRVSFKDKAWWLQLGGKIGLRIESEDQHLFSAGELEALQGRTVQARGWLVPMDGGWWMMEISHPSMLKSGDQRCLDVLPC